MAIQRSLFAYLGGEENPAIASALADPSSETSLLLERYASDGQRPADTPSLFSSFLAEIGDMVPDPPEPSSTQAPSSNEPALEPSREGESITFLLGRMRDGDSEALQKLWNRYYEALLMEFQPGPTPAGPNPHSPVIEDNQDAAIQTTLQSFLAAVQNGRFPRVGNRRDLWEALRAYTQHRLNKNSKGQGGERADPDSPRHRLSLFRHGLDESLKDILDQVDSEIYRHILQLRLRGYSRDEICDVLPTCPNSMIKEAEQRFVAIAQGLMVA